MTNSKRPIRRPEDFHGLNIRVVGIPIFADIFRTLGANPVSIDFAKALEAFRLGPVDGQENPLALIIPYKLWAVHNYITLWRYTIDPTILAVSGKTWMSIKPEDRKILREVGELMMAVQKKEAREGLENASITSTCFKKSIKWKSPISRRPRSNRSATRPVPSTTGGLMTSDSNWSAARRES